MNNQEKREGSQDGTETNAFNQGFNDCILECMMYMIDQENISSSDPILNEMISYLINKRNCLSMEMTTESKMNNDKNKSEFINSFQKLKFN